MKGTPVCRSHVTVTRFKGQVVRERLRHHQSSSPDVARFARCAFRRHIPATPREKKETRREYINRSEQLLPSVEAGTVGITPPNKGERRKKGRMEDFVWARRRFPPEDPKRATFRARS